MLGKRRNSYLAQTLSHVARAKLDHAVSRASEDLESALAGEKWEMR